MAFFLSLQGRSTGAGGTVTLRTGWLSSSVRSISMAFSSSRPEPVRILTFSTLYPNAEMPRHGLFVRERLKHLIATHPVTSEIIAPVPWFPVSGPWFGRYGTFAKVPLCEVTPEGRVSHPRFFTLPRLGNFWNPLGA